MFLSESIARAIHADRVREIERVTRERRLLEPAAEPFSPVQPEPSSRCLSTARPASRRTGVAV